MAGAETGAAGDEERADFRFWTFGFGRKCFYFFKADAHVAVLCMNDNSSLCLLSAKPLLPLPSAFRVFIFCTGSRVIETSLRLGELRFQVFIKPRSPPC